MRRTGLAAGAGCLALTSVLVSVPLAAPKATAEPGARPMAAPTTNRPTTKPTKKPTRKPTTKPTKKDEPERPRPPTTPRGCQQRPVGYPASAIKVEPWALRRLDFEDAWKSTKGKGVKVAVVDSGIETRNPQLAGKVVDSFDATGGGDDDCVGHGTAVAGIIAAADMRDRKVPFYGVAPEVQLLAAKITATERFEDTTAIPRGIKWAAANGAKVINVSAQIPDTRLLREAVRYAQGKDALIVAAAGNVPEEERGKEGPAYPAHYPGVLSVAAADEAGTIADFSNIKTRIDVSAPGTGVLSTWGKGYQGPLDGTSYGAPYAAGVAALVRAQHRDLNYQQVINRILITAEGDNGQGSGHGMISPLQAVSAVIDKNARPAKGGNRPLAGSVRIAPVPPTDHRTRNLGLGIAGGALGLGAMVAFGAIVIPRGRKRGWKPGRAAPASDDKG